MVTTEMYTLVELAVSAALLVTLITVLSACVCGCKNSNQKSELVGTAGVVKIHLDEEAPSPTPTTPASVKRASTQNSQRSLPEIPHPVGRHDSGDTASEIYATVNLDESNKAAITASTSRESRDHPYDHPYAKVQTQNDSHNVTVEVTPDRATISDRDIQVDERDASTSGPESVVISASVAISGQLPSSQELPYITPPAHAPAPAPPAPAPSPRPDTAVHFSGDSTDSAKGYTSISVREPLSNIRAQSAAGGTGGTGAAQPHYATVSDDSDEMYAAIEEGAAGAGAGAESGSDTYAQIAPAPRRARDPPPPAPPAPPAAHHHVPALHADTARRSAPPEVGATVSGSTLTRKASSTSCTISTGASTSTVTTAAGANALGSPKPEKRSANSPLPPPPSSVPHTTASRASAADQRHQRMSSTGDLFAHDKLRRSLNEKHQRNNSCVSSSDFYGCNYPVEKHRFSSGDPLIRPLVAKELNFNFDIDTQDPLADNLYNSIEGPACSDYSSEANVSKTPEQRTTESPSRNLEEMYAKVMKRSKGKTDDSVRRSKDFSEREAQKSKYRRDDPGYETIDRKKSTNDGYETIAHKEWKISNQDPGYETVKEINKGLNSNFNNNLLKLNMTDSGPNSLMSSDPGYEHISKNDNNASDSDPNYEVLRNQPPTPPYATIAPNYKIQPTYSTVSKRPSKYSNWPANNNDDEGAEPNYESMPHDPLYAAAGAAAAAAGGSESDPNYESVRPKDPNYETVGAQDPNYESLRSRDPKYESVRSKDSKYDSVRSRKDPNYESVKYFEVSNKEPPYEKLKNDSTASSSIERSDSSAGYEKINVPSNRDPKSSISNGTDAPVSDYFQV